MRGTTFLVAVAVLFSLHAAHAEEESAEAEAPVQAAEYLGTQRYALVIGIDAYADGGIPDLRNSETNARGVLAVLADPQTGGLPEANVQSLLGAEATAPKIRAALGRLGQVPREATVFVYFAGHGAAAGESAYWVPQDAKASDLPATAIAASEVRRLLEQVPAERILLVMDCFHAPGLGGESGAEVDPKVVLARYHGKRHATLGAAGSKEHAIDAQGSWRSVFTHYLVEGLSGQAEADGDGVVALSELATYVGRRVRAEARKRPGLERPVVDLEGVPEPSQFFLTIEQEGFRDRLLEDEPAQTRRRERLAALTALVAEDRITTEQGQLGRNMLGGLEEGFASLELEQRTMFFDLAEGRLDPEHLTGALAAVRRADRRTLVVPDEFQTIQAAIDAGAPGDTVFVKEGRYDERVVFKTGLCLRGEGREQTVLRMVPGEKEMLLAQDCAWGTIESLQLDGTGGEKIGDWSPDGIHLERSSVRIRDCLSYNCLGGGLYASGAGSRPHVQECAFEKNGQDGLCFDGTHGGMIVDCICRSNGAVGLQVRQSRGAVTVRACQCEFNVQAGIGVCAGSTATVTGNDCPNNGGHGIIVWDKETSVTLEDNTCSGNEIYGIYVVLRASAVANRNDCSRNKESGFVVSGVGSRATVVGSRCLDNDTSETGSKCGIVFTDGAAGEATSNTCDGNACGILVTGSSTSARLRDNTCRRNEASGIEFSEAAKGHAIANRCEENGQGITVSRAEATLEANTLQRNRVNGLLICVRGTGKASGNRCEENEEAGILVTDMGTRAELLKNTCASNGSHGIQFARGAGGTADGNDCRGNKAFGIVAFDSGTRPTFRRNLCTDNGSAGIGQRDGAAPVVEGDNVLSGNGR